MKFLLLYLLPALALDVAAADRDWSAVERLSPGQKLEVQLEKGGYERGVLERASRDSLRFASGLTIAQPEVRRVIDRSRSRRGRNALIGAGIGAAAGLIFERTLGTYLRNEGAGSEFNWYLWVIPIGLGAGFGSAIPSHPTIYRK